MPGIFYQMHYYCEISSNHFKLNKKITAMPAHSWLSGDWCYTSVSHTCLSIFNPYVIKLIASLPASRKNKKLQR